MASGRLEVGRITRAHGLDGGVVVKLVSNRPDLRMVPGARLFAADRCLVVAGAQPHKGDWLVHLDGVDDRSAADALRGAVLEAEPVEETGTLWVHDLVGAPVVDTGGASLGTVVAVVANPAADLLELDGGRLVPLTFLVRFEAGVVTVDPPAGLFDL